MSDQTFILDENPSVALGQIVRLARAEDLDRRFVDRKAALDQQIAERETSLAELRSSLENPQTPLSFPAEWLLDIWQGGATDSGIRVSEMTVLQVSTGFACVQLLANTIAALDFNIYERYLANNKRVGKRLAFDHDLFDLFENEPNIEMTAFQFKKALMVHRCIWGNSYAEIERNGAGNAIALWPRNPARCKPYRTHSGLLVYKTSEGLDDVTIPGIESNTEGPQRTIFAENMLHVPGLSIDARLGLSTSFLLRQVFGLALAAEKFGGKLFANGARPGGILIHPGKLSDKARANLKQSWNEAQGGENAHRLAVLEEAIKYEKISSTAEEAQFLQTREYQRVEVCSVFGVPPHMIGDSGKSNRANTEQLGAEFLTYGLNPHIKADQQEVSRKLFPKVGRSSGKFFPKYDTRPLVMPDAASRKDFYSAGKQWGFLCTDDILELEHLEPTSQPGSNLYWQPVNMGIMSEEGATVPARTPDPDAAIPAAGGDEDDPDAPAPKAKAKPAADPAKKIGRSLLRIYSATINDAFRRIQARSKPGPDAFRHVFLPVLVSISEAVDELSGGEGAGAAPKFLEDLVEGIRLRAKDGQFFEIATNVERETSRIIRAITIEVFRSLATIRAKEQTEELTA